MTGLDRLFNALTKYLVVCECASKGLGMRILLFARFLPMLTVF